MQEFIPLIMHPIHTDKQTSAVLQITIKCLTSIRTRLAFCAVVVTNATGTGVWTLVTKLVLVIESIARKEVS